MNIETTKNFIKLTPAEGKQLYNGEIYSECVYMAVSSDISVWIEIDFLNMNNAEVR